MRSIVAENGGQAEQNDACNDTAAQVELMKRPLLVMAISS